LGKVFLLYTNHFDTSVKNGSCWGPRILQISVICKSMHCNNFPQFQVFYSDGTLRTWSMERTTWKL